MYNFNFYMPTKVLFGPGKLNELHSEFEGIRPNPTDINVMEEKILLTL